MSSGFRGRWVRWLTVAGVAVIAWPAAGQEGQREPEVLLPESLKLARLVDLAGEITGQPYSYAPGELDATVTLRVPGGLRRAQVPELLSHVLASRGLTTVRSPGSPMLSVVRLEQAASLASTGASEGAGFVTEIIPVRHQSARTLAEAIRALVSRPGGAVSVLGESQALMVSDLAPRLAEIRSILTQLDVPDSTVVTEVSLQFITASQAATTLSQITAKRESTSGRRLIGDVVPSADGGQLLLVCTPEAQAQWLALIATIDRREPLETRTYTPLLFPAEDVAKLVEAASSSPTSTPSDESITVVVDDLTGALIITTSTSRHARIAAFIERLDSRPSGGPPIRAFPIRNRSVEEVVTTLSRLIDAGALSADSTGLRTHAGPPSHALVPAASSTSGAPASEGSSADRASERKGSLRLTADNATNTLIAIGEPRDLSQLESLLAVLDVRQPQVMLEAVLVSLTESDARNLGVELEKLGTSGDVAFRLASLFGLSTAGAGGRTVADALGFTGAVLNPGDFSVVLRALQAINEGRSLSRPRVLVANNEQARFSSVLQQPFVRTDTNNGTATSSFGGNESAGTTISVRPQIAQGDHLVLTYNIDLSSFVGTPAAAGLPPPKQQNSVTSVATIPDGHVVVVGGLELESESTSTSQLPILGDVPLIGELFKSRAHGISRTRFFVFIRASVFRTHGFEELKFLSNADAEAALVEDGWPEVEARVIP